jgi:UDP-N-acetylmuramyl pentapeptide synthase
LAEIADPDIGLITSVAAAHLEGLHNLAGVAREKGALYRAVRRDGTIAVNLDDPWVRRLGAKFSGKKITYGAAGRLRARSLRVRAAQGMAFELHHGGQKVRIRLNYLGRHNVTNALGAAALALAAGVGLPAVRRGLAQAKPFTMRMQRESWRGIGIVNDSYNANPGSMQAALETLALIGGRGKKIAVLGDMFELGEHTGKEHRGLGRFAARAKIHQLYLLGEQAPQVRSGALSAGMKSHQVIIAADHGDIVRRLREQLRRGDWLLVKGSRGMKMEKVLQELKGVKA